MLLFLNGHSTKELELMQRKELLKEALTETPNLKFNYHVENEGKAFYKSIEKSDLEGMMAKKKKSTYQEGVRSQAWLKVKNHKTDDAVIVGYTKPQGSRKKFGSLILGQYRDGKLHFAGHVGTGFSDKSLKDLYNDTISGSKKSVSPDKKSSGSKESTSSSKESSDSNEPISNDKDSSSESKKSVSNSKNSSSTEDSSSDNKLKLTNLDKLYWKKEKITKGDLIDYYLSVSDYILPHLKDRAQSLHRFPDGIESPGFYHKDAGKGAPSWVKRVISFLLCWERVLI
jgi:bifunctional non-homologous end joining protein LigD